MSDWNDIERMKRQMPLEALEALKGLKFGTNVRLIGPDISHERMFRLEEKPEFSDFFFEVKSFGSQRNIQGFTCYCKPTSEHIPSPTSVFVPTVSLGKKIEWWGDLIAKYHTTETILDDPAAQAHYEHYSELVPLTLVGPDVEKPFTGGAVIRLLQHCDELISEVETKVQDSPERELFIADVRALQDDLASETRGVVFERLKRIWAKGSVKFPRIIKFLLDNVASWAIQKGLDGVVIAIDKL